MSEHEKTAEVGRFIEFGSSALKRIHLSREADRFVSARELLACNIADSYRQNLYNIVYADRSGLCSSSYIGTANGVSFLDKDEVQSEVLSIDDVPKYKWGDAQCTAERLLSVVQNNTLVSSNRIGYWMNGIDDDLFCQADLESLKVSCQIYQPVLMEGGSIALYLNQRDLDRGRCTSMKVGRAFKHMFQNMSDAQVARLHDLWLDETRPRTFTLKVGRSIKDFSFAYTADRVVSRNLASTRADYKSLAMSCMHGEEVLADYDGERLPMSPASVYASGDFEIAYLVEQNSEENKVAGRVIYSIGSKDEDGHVVEDKINAPVYAACEQSGQMLRDHLSSIDCHSSSDLSEWSGLRLLKIEAAHHDNYIAPYLDGDVACELGRKHIILDTFGSIALSSTEGLLHDGVYCIICDVHISEDEAFYSDDGPMCDCCYHENYGICSESGDSHPIDDLIEVNYEFAGNRFCHKIVHLDYARYCECVEQWWFEDDVTISDDGDFVPTHRIDDFPELFDRETQEEVA